MDENKGELETVSEQIKEQESTEQQGQPQDDVPEKYRGRKFSDVIAELEMANKNMGRYANELGEVRKLADDLIKSQLKPVEQKQVGNKPDIFEDPDGYVRNAVESNPRLQAIEKYAMQAQQETVRQRMMQLHPDALELAQDSKFQDWVGASNVRKELFARADKFDIDAANELFSTYKELNASRNNALSESEKQARKKAIGNAEVDSGGSGEKSKKIYKRSELLDKMARDKKWFAANMEEITAAYAEGRVR